jgi:hypothetical protein
MKDVVVELCAFIAGLWLAQADLRTDDTGIMATLLLAVALVLSAIRPHMALWIALAVGLPIPIIEIAGGASLAPLAALLFAGAGAALGAVGGRLMRRSARVV